MKQAVGHLVPFIEEEKTRSGDAGKPKGTIVMATVKGDVHDIGKNIVGVVLQCNNFDVIDLGVMVPAQRILATAQDATPTSSACQRSDYALARGDGARCARDAAPRHAPAAAYRRRDHARVHTAVKIAPNYAGVTVYVPDASRAVGVASNLLSEDLARSLRCRCCGRL